MKKMNVIVLIILVLVPLLLSSMTLDEKKEKAVKLVNDGAEFLKTNGLEKSKAAFNDPKGKFVEGEFYLFVFTPQLVCVSHAENASLMGKNMIDTKDADGKLFIREFAKVTNKSEKGWVDYKWKNYTTNKVSDKSSYVMKVKTKEGDFIIGCGIYK